MPVKFIFVVYVILGDKHCSAGPEYVMDPPF